MEPKTISEIMGFWQNAARSEVDAQGLRPTARDPYLQLAVEDIIEGYLNENLSVLDIGCGDGLSSLRFAATAKQIIGVDYIEEFVARSRANSAKQNAKNTLFEQGDVTDLQPIRDRYGTFDIVISIRCLINLPNWELQQKGLAEIARSVRPGGLFLCSEGWLEAWEGLNRFRVHANLEPIQVVPYNKLISRIAFEAYAGQSFDRIAYHGLGLYLFMSRIVQPYLVRPDPPSHTHILNKVGCELQGLLNLGTKFEDCDFAGVLVFRRKKPGRVNR